MNPNDYTLKLTPLPPEPSRPDIDMSLPDSLFDARVIRTTDEEETVLNQWLNLHPNTLTFALMVNHLINDPTAPPFFRALARIARIHKVRHHIAEIRLINERLNPKGGTSNE